MELLLSEAVGVIDASLYPSLRFRVFGFWRSAMAETLGLSIERMNLRAGPPPPPPPPPLPPVLVVLVLVVLVAEGGLGGPLPLADRKCAIASASLCSIRVATGEILLLTLPPFPPTFMPLDMDMEARSMDCCRRALAAASEMSSALISLCPMGREESCCMEREGAICLCAFDVPALEVLEVEFELELEEVEGLELEGGGGGGIAEDGVAFLLELLEIVLGGGETVFDVLPIPIPMPIFIPNVERVGDETADRILPAVLLPFGFCCVFRGVFCRDAALEER